MLLSSYTYRLFNNTYIPIPIYTYLPTYLPTYYVPPTDLLGTYIHTYKHTNYLIGYLNNHLKAI